MTETTAAQSNLAHQLGLDRPADGNARKRRRLAALIAGALVLVILLVAWRVLRRPEGIRFTTQEALRGDLTVVVTATGTLQPTNKVDVGCELSGIIKTVEADYNDHVTVGQVLARIDPTKIQAQVTQSRAALKSAQAKVLQAKATVAETQSKIEQYRKVRDLSNNQVPSKSDMDAAEAALGRAQANEASAQADAAQAQATLAANETDLSKLVIRSPINGIVLTRSVEPGQTVAAAFATPTMFTLAEDLSKMRLHVNVDEADVGKVAEGQSATFTVAAYPDRKFKAVILQARFGSSATSGVVTYETVLSVDNADLSLRPGMTATASITVKRVENALLVPTAALRFTPVVPSSGALPPSGGLVGSLIPHPPQEDKSARPAPSTSPRQQVWALKEGKPAPVPVTIGATDGSRSEVLEGAVSAGMALIVDAVTAEK